MVAESETRLIEGLRRRDEGSYRELVDQLGVGLHRVARNYVKDDAGAEEVVQETWLAVLQGIDRFESRSSLKSWIYAILVKRAMTRGKRDARSLPFSSLAKNEMDAHDPSVAPERFAGAHSEYPRHWITSPESWSDKPEEAALAKEAQRLVREAIAVLPQAQRAVVEMRDLAGQDSGEIARDLQLSEANVRVLLHRGRSKVRRALEEYYTGKCGESAVGAGT